MAPTIAPFSFGDETLNAGDFVVVQCSAAKGDSPLVLGWFFHGHQVTSDQSGVSINKLGDRISVLSIQSVTAGHSGDYTCSAKNPAGIANFTATLTVNGSVPEGVPEPCPMSIRSDAPCSAIFDVAVFHETFLC